MRDVYRGIAESKYDTPGRREARAALTPPPFPDVCVYLWRWAHELFGRSGIGLNGPAPLSYPCLAAWSTLTGQRPTPREVRALIRIDAALRVGLAGKKPRRIDQPWPDKKPDDDSPPTIGAS